MTYLSTRGTRVSRTSRARITAVATTVFLSAGALFAVPAAASASPVHQHSERFTSTTGTDWIVPPGVTTIHVDMGGGRGANSSWGGGGNGTQLMFDLAVTPGDVLTSYGATNASGRSGGKGLVNGGNGGDKSGKSDKGGGGGGAAGLKLNGTLVAVAGGGGGGGGSLETCSNSQGCIPRFGGNGGQLGGNGSKGESFNGNHPGNGGAGSALVGKSGGNGSSAATLSEGGGGGGGGGGYASGAGGSSGKKFNGMGPGGGGGGGSSLAPAGATTDTNADWDGGYVKLSYDAPVALGLTMLSPTLVADASSYLSVTATEGTTDTKVYGRFRVTANGVMKEWFGYSNVIELKLPAGTHTISAEFWENGAGTTRSSIEVTVPGSQLASPPPAAGEPLIIDLDTVPTHTQYNQVLRVTGTLTDAAGNPVPGIGVHAGLDDLTDGYRATTDADGRFSVSFHANRSPGTVLIVETRPGAQSPYESSRLELPIRMVHEIAQVRLTVTPTALSYGQPATLRAAVTAADGGSYVAPTGTVAFATDDDIIALGTLNASGISEVADVVIPAGTSQLRALYVGDSHFADAASDPVTVTVSDTPTTTTLSVSSLTGRAGDTTAIRATVTATGSPREPSGHVELLLGDEVIDTASIGEDADTVAGDGTVAYDFDTADIPAGTHSLTARFVPGPGYGASTSDVANLTLAAYETHLSVSPSSIDITEGDTAVASAHLTVLGVEGGGELMRSRSAGPEIAGSIVVFRGDDIIDHQEVDPATNAVEFTLTGLTVGSGSLRIAFVPDTLALATTSTEIPLEVRSAAGPDTHDPAASDDLARTGASGDAPTLALIAGAVALFGALLVARFGRTPKGHVR